MFGNDLLDVWKIGNFTSCYSNKKGSNVRFLIMRLFFYLTNQNIYVFDCRG